MPLEIEIVNTPDLALLRCRGRVVFGDGATVLRDATRQALSAGQAVALDLGRVTQMDAHGTGVLAELSTIARDEGRALVLARASDRVRRLMRVTRLDTLIPAAKDAAVHAGAAASEPPLVCHIGWPCHAAGARA